MNYSVEAPGDILLQGSFNTTEGPNVSVDKIQFYWEGRLALGLNEYYLLCLCPISIVLNSAAVLTISKLKPFTTSSLYVILLAIFDSLALIAKLLFLRLTLHDVDLGDAGCKIISFFGSFLDQFSVWILVLLTIERFVAVWLPLKVSCWFTMFRARIAVIVTAMCLLLINSNILVTLRQVETDRGRNCFFHAEYEFFVTRVWYWMESCLSAIIPCIILTILNYLIICRMRTSMDKQKQMLSGMENPNTTKQAHKTHLTVMLVTVSVSFVIMVLPLAVFNVFRGTWDTSTSAHERAKFYMTAEITHFLADCNHGLNFLFYFLSSRRFRRMCWMILRCKSYYPMYTGTTRNSYLKSTTSTTNTYYLHTSMRTNSGL